MKVQPIYITLIKIKVKQMISSFIHNLSHRLPILPRHYLHPLQIMYPYFLLSKPRLHLHHPNAAGWMTN